MGYSMILDLWIHCEMNDKYYLIALPIHLTYLPDQIWGEKHLQSGVAGFLFVCVSPTTFLIMTWRPFISYERSA